MKNRGTIIIIIEQRIELKIQVNDFLEWKETGATLLE